MCVKAGPMFHNCWDLTSRVCSKHISEILTRCHKDPKGRVENPTRGQLGHHVSVAISGREINFVDLGWWKINVNPLLNLVQYFKQQNIWDALALVLVQLIICTRFCYNQHIPDPLLKNFLEISSVFLELAFSYLTFKKQHIKSSQQQKVK